MLRLFVLVLAALALQIVGAGSRVGANTLDETCLFVAPGATVNCAAIPPVVPPPPPYTVANHQPTSMYCCQGFSNDWPSGGIAAAAPFLTMYANPSAAGADALVAAGITTEIYTYADPAVVRGSNSGGNEDFFEWPLLCGGATFGPPACNTAATYYAAVAKNCSNVVVTDYSASGSPPPPPAGNTGPSGGVFTDPRQAASVPFWNASIANAYNASGGYDTAFLDDIGTWEGSATSSTLCGWAEPTISSAYASLIASLHLTLSGAQTKQPKYLINAGALSVYRRAADANNTTLAALLAAANIWGIACENCLSETTPNSIDGTDCNPYDQGDGPAGTNGTICGGPTWASIMNQKIQTIALGKVWFHQAQDALSTTSAPRFRLFTMASGMLVYSQALERSQNDFYGYSPANPGSAPNALNPQLHVWPEQKLVGYTPLVPDPPAGVPGRGIQDLGVGCASPGQCVYKREYANCYYDGVLLNAAGAFHGCAFIVNPGAATHPLPTLAGTYTHTMTINTNSCTVPQHVSPFGRISLAGACDVLDGGGVSMTGPALPGTLAIATAYVAVP